MFSPNYWNHSCGDGRGRRCKSQKWWTKAACETGAGIGSTATLGAWKVKQNPEAPVLQLVHTQSEPSACDSSAPWLHHTAPFNSSTANAAQVSLCSHPALLHRSANFLHLINISLFQHSGLDQPVVVYGLCILVTCPDHVCLHIRCRADSECSAMRSKRHHCFASWALYKPCQDLTSLCLTPRDTWRPQTVKKLHFPKATVNLQWPHLTPVRGYLLTECCNYSSEITTS